MGTPLTPVQMLRRASDHLIVSVEDFCELWPVVKDAFENRSPFRRAILNNKARNPVLVERLPVEYILTTDARLRGRTAVEQSPFWFRHPYANIVLVTCEDLEEYKNLLKPRLKQIVNNEEREWFIVFVSKSSPNDTAGKLTKRAYSRLESDFSSKKRERCCRIETLTQSMDTLVWEDIDNKILECVRNTLDRRVQFYEEEVRRHLEYRRMPAWNFSNFFVVKESLAIMFEMAHLLEDALREYDEVEQIYSEIVNAPHMKAKEFGGLDFGDERAAILDASRKSLPQFSLEDSVREFDFRQYLFARQALLLFRLNRPSEVAARAFPFILTFSRSLSQQERRLPFCLREIWVLSACLTVVKATAERFNRGAVTPDVEKDFYRLQGDLYSYARTKLMRLGDLIGYGSRIEKSPCNSAALSMLPWPKPAIWPSVPADAASRIAAKQQAESKMSQASCPPRKELPLAPGILLREANRRRASLSAGNLSDLVDSTTPTRGSFRRSDSFAGEDGSLRRTNSKVGANGNGTAESELPSPRTVPSSPGTASTPGHARPGSPAVPTLTPTLSWGAIDNPMKLGEIQVGAEDALLAKLSGQSLHRALASMEGFEEMYLELTRAAATNYHRSWRKRHAVVLDGEVAAVHYRRGNLDSAANLYEKVCALYAGERWHALLAEVLHRLADCQKQLGDFPGYLSSCIKLLSLDMGLLSREERQGLQSEMVRLARSGLKSSISLDVSALITFTSKGGPPLELVEGDPGNLLVIVWSGFPDDISLDTLSLTLTTFGGDEFGKVIKSAERPVLHPGKNGLSIPLPAQQTGSYVLSVLNANIGDIKLGSHSYGSTSAASCKGGPPDGDDFLSSEKPLQPVLEVSRARELVSLKAAVSWRLLIGERQWVGIIITPMGYSLKGASVTICSGGDLDLDLFQAVQFEAFDPSDSVQSAALESHSSPELMVPSGIESAEGKKHLNSNGTTSDHAKSVVMVKDGKVELPEWAADIPSVLWLRVIARDRDDQVKARSPSQQPDSPLSPKSPKSPRKETMQRTVSIGNAVNDITSPVSIPDDGPPVPPGGISPEGIRSLNVKLEFGAGRARTCERDISVQYTKPFCTTTRVVSQGNDGTLLLQVALASQLVATTTILDVMLHLQEGFLHVNANERPCLPWLLPLSLSATSEGAILFLVRYEKPKHAEEDHFSSNGEVAEATVGVQSRLTVHYKISGNRMLGAHPPVSADGNSVAEDCKMLTFTSDFYLQMPVLEQLLAVGMLPAPSRSPRVGQQVVLRWRIERLVEGGIMDKTSMGSKNASTEEPTSLSQQGDFEELGYELRASPETWMIAGRVKGAVKLPFKVNSRIVISVACVPLLAGHVHPPTLCLANISRAHVSSSPSGPHIVCVLPPAPCSTLCVSKVV